MTLDEPLVLGLAKSDPALFFQRYQPPLLIDEIQYAPELLPYIKIIVDSQKQPGQFWLTGSQQFHLMRGVSESLAGRVAILRLMGLAHKEIQDESQTQIPFLPGAEFVEQPAHKLPLNELYHLIWRGAYPAIALNSEIDWRLFYSSYVQTYLQRDVRDLAKVGDKQAFVRFLKVVAARTGQLLNLASLARDADIAPNTAKSWLSILEASDIVYLLQPYHSNISKRLIKAPKLYMLDTGLCAFLTDWTSAAALESGAMSGAILETWVICELLKSYVHNGRHAPFYFYRDKDQAEIDLLIIENGLVYPLEIKKTASPSIREAKAFERLPNLKLKVGAGGLICLAEQFLPLSCDSHQLVQAIPVSAL